MSTTIEGHLGLRNAAELFRTYGDLTAEKAYLLMEKLLIVSEKTRKFGSMPLYYEAGLRITPASV